MGKKHAKRYKQPKWLIVSKFKNGRRQKYKAGCRVIICFTGRTTEFKGFKKQFICNLKNS